MIHEITFDSKDHSTGKLLNLACGYISLSQIVFTNENIIINIESRKGEIDIFDSESNKLLSAKVELPSFGDEKYSEVKCAVKNSIITLGFPKYTYEDNYPNCDGEYDRWTKKIDYYRFFCYDIKNNCFYEKAKD